MALEVEELPSRWEGTREGYWTWRVDGRQHRIRYQRAGDHGPAILLIHGFGGNCDHWRKNTAAIAKEGFRVFSIDLLGYGYSDKPDPRELPRNALYNFETWGRQVVDFLDQVVQGPASLVCNSVGGLAGLDAAIRAPGKVPLVMLLDISLRMLHAKRQNPLTRPLVSAFQDFLHATPAGTAFFGNVAQPGTVKRILTQAYGDPATVTDELVDCILRPGLTEGAPRVFLDFISYSGGPLPEEQLARVPKEVPVVMLWGEKDPWEKIEWGRELAKQPSVRAFVPLPGVGHCPQDEAPDVVNPLVVEWVRRAEEERSARGAGAESAQALGTGSLIVDS